MAEIEIDGRKFVVPDEVSKSDFYLWASTAVQNEIDMTQDHKIDPHAVEELLGADRRKPIPSLEDYFAYVEGGRRGVPTEADKKRPERDDSDSASKNSRSSSSRVSKASIESKMSRDSRSRRTVESSRKEESSFVDYNKPAPSVASNRSSSTKKNGKKEGPSFLPSEDDVPLPDLPEPDPERERFRDDARSRSRSREDYDYGFPAIASEPGRDEEEEARSRREERDEEEEEKRKPRSRSPAFISDDEREVDSRPGTSRRLKYVDEEPMSEELNKNLKIREIVDCEIRLDMLYLPKNDADAAREIRNKRYADLQRYSMRDLSTYHTSLDNDIYVKNEVAKNRWYIQRALTVAEEFDKMTNLRALTNLCKDIEHTREGWHLLDAPLEQIARSKRRSQINPYVAIATTLGKLLGYKILENKVFKGNKMGLSMITDGPPSTAMDVPPPPPMARTIEPPSNVRSEPAPTRRYQEENPPATLSNRNVDPSRTQGVYGTPTAAYPADMDPSGEYPVEEDYDSVDIPVL